MATTLEVFSGQPAANYCTNPTLDVEIGPLDSGRCLTCTEAATFAYTADPRTTGWTHESGREDHSVTPAPTCHYCRCSDPELVTFHQHAWHDSIDCRRCGGSQGWPIGD